MATGFVLQTADGAAYAVYNPLRLGRDPKGQVVLADERVSRHHATAWTEGGRLYLRDENSSNGTHVNGRRLAPGETVTLQPGDQIQLGGIYLLAGLAADPLQSAPRPVPAPGGPPPGATVKMQVPPPPPPPARPRSRSRLPLLAGCGALLALLVCVSVIAGALALYPRLLDPGPVTPPSAVPATPDSLDGTPASPTPEAEATTAAGAATEVVITPAAIVPAATPLSVASFAEESASLANLIAGLNTAELRFVQAAAGEAAPAELDQALQAVAAEALRVGVRAQQLGESAAVDVGVSAAAASAAANYNAVARLAFALVIEAHTLRDDLAHGAQTPSEAMHLIAEYGLRLWQPTFDAPPPVEQTNTSDLPPSLAGRVAHSPFLAFTLQPFEAPPVQFLGPEAVEAILAAGGPEAALQGWLVVSSDTITRTLSLPAHGLPPADPFDPAAIAPLLEPAGHASPEGAFTARAIAQAYLSVLGGALDSAPAAPGGGLQRPAAYQGTPTPLTVGLPSRAVAGGANPSPGANPALPNLAGGQITSILKSPVRTMVLGGQASQQSHPEVIAYERQDRPGHTVQLSIEAVSASYGAGLAQFKPGQGGLGLMLRFGPAPGALNPGPAAGGNTLVCQATGLPAQAVAVPSSSGVQAMAFVVEVGVDYAVRCFILANVQTNGAQSTGLVVGRTETIVVKLPGAGPDGDQDGVTDEFDRCPDEPEDRDDVVDFDGCPETDADNDGVLDLPDACPDLAGPPPQGCPEVDSDGDAVPDHKDKCPQQAEDKDGIADDDGCPETDLDADGLPDAADRCPDEKEDPDGFEDNDGCLDRDNDQDKHLDEEDFCPNEPETANRYLDDDGCPDAWPKLTLTGTINEAAADKAGNAFGFSTSFNLTLDFASGTIAGTLTSSGAARVQFTCFNVSDPSETYDTAEAAYSLTYSAPANGAGYAPNGLAVVAIAPKGNVGASVARPYTHEQCTHLNDDPISGTGAFTGSGTLTVVANDLGQAKVSVEWNTSAFSSAGSWSGRGTFN